MVMDATHVIRGYAATVEDVSAQERMVTARINTASVDRYRSVIDPAGGDLSKYNRVVLWEHGKDPTRGSLPIGKCSWIKRVGNEIRARTQFAKDDYSQALFEMYRDGMLNGWSVNVLPQAGSYGPPTQAERARPEMAGCETVYRKWELAEYSGVAVPGNAEALSMLEARGIWFPSDRRVDEPSPRPLPEPMAASEAAPAIPAELEGLEPGQRLQDIRRTIASEFAYTETRLMTQLHDLLDLKRGRV